MRNDVILVTTTMYPSRNTRFKLARVMLNEALGQGLRVHLWDASPEEVRQEFRRFENVEVFEQKAGVPMFENRRAAFARALESLPRAGAVVWLEPEKDTLPGLLSRCIAPVVSGEADLVVIGRESFASYPTNQQKFEFLGNCFFGHYTGVPCDVWFAPRVFNARAGKFFAEYDGQYGGKWDSVFVPVVQAIGAGHRVVEVKVDFTYPPAQCREEEGNSAMDEKRYDQFTLLVNAIREESKRLGLPRPV